MLSYQGEQWLAHWNGQRTGTLNFDVLVKYKIPGRVPVNSRGQAVTKRLSHGCVRSPFVTLKVFITDKLDYNWVIGDHLAQLTFNSVPSGLTFSFIFYMEKT